VEILIVGGGIGGLTLALSLQQAGITCRVFEAAREIRPLGVGINILPHGARELTELGLAPRLARAAVETRELCGVNRFGQFIFREPRGRFAGYPWPQWSIHRADLHEVLLQAVHERLGPDCVQLNKKLVSLEQDGNSVELHFEDGSGVKGAAAVGCDGIHSVVQKILFPGNEELSYQGINMWRGVTRCKPFLSGASMIIGGWLEIGKLVVYPIRENVDQQGRQLVNWVAEIQSPRNVMQDWSLPGRLEDFLPAFESWRFDWLDVPAMMRAAEAVYEYPMVDREPLAAWTRGRVTLLGDAAHPMYPVGSNGASQAILDARCLADALARSEHPRQALAAYERQRLPMTADIVASNRRGGPEGVIDAVEQLAPQGFSDVDTILNYEAREAIVRGYAAKAGFAARVVSR